MTTDPATEPESVAGLWLNNNSRTMTFPITNLLLNSGETGHAPSVSHVRDVGLADPVAFRKNVCGVAGCDNLPRLFWRQLHAVVSSAMGVPVKWLKVIHTNAALHSAFVVKFNPDRNGSVRFGVSNTMNGTHRPVHGIAVTPVALPDVTGGIESAIFLDPHLRFPLVVSGKKAVVRATHVPTLRVSSLYPRRDLATTAFAKWRGIVHQAASFVVEQPNYKCQEVIN